jgi:hypothetical protein
MLMPSVKYLRGVECSCGFLALKGHGVGMCKRGAIVMARRGASFEQILRHYYRGVVVIHAASQETAAPEPEPPARVATPPLAAAEPLAAAPAVTPPRAAVPAEHPRRPQLAKNGQEQHAARPRKSKESPAPTKASTPSTHAQPAKRKPREEIKPANGRTEELTVPVEARHKPPVKRSRPPELKTPKLRGVLVGEVVSESGSLNTAKPAKPARRVQIDHLPGNRMIAGTLPEAGIEIVIEDSHGNKTAVMSGSAEHYGGGGFELMVEEDGRYLVTIDDQVVEVQVDGETVFIYAA